MGDKVEGQVCELDINSIRASLIIPLAITVFCSALDMLCQIKLAMVSITAFKDGMFWALGALISYFFPSFLAASITLLWQYYFAKSWSGIKEGKGLLLFSGTFIYFFFYVVYLLYADTYYIICFAILNIVYAVFVIDKCIDKEILQRRSGISKGKVVNSPN